MRMRNVLGLCAASALLTACGDSGEIEAPLEENADSTIGQPSAVAQMNDTNGDSVGEVHFYEEGNLTRVSATVEGLSPGYHGFHLHEESMCEVNEEEDPFESAGGHYHSDDDEHGSHTGDMPSLFVIEDGTAQLSFTTDAFSTEDLIETTSVMIHEDPDNFGHIPDRYTSDEQETSGPDEETATTGDAGDRIACGVVEAS
ncbi:superoxide dismutase family protein [Shouchella patagoniensis]|uniref:superoxide dismutase family protein n=1 Tax=Shouchella patagoniensis TaxID=228576 RepID=UPI000995BF9A|nr:superoxide dismutase family protein [Shouchella patagoniensis]